jgi:tight adherence protein B
MIPWAAPLVLAALVSVAGMAIAALAARRRADAVARRIRASVPVPSVRRAEAAPSPLLAAPETVATPFVHLLDGMGLRTRAERLAESSGLAWGLSGLARAAAACFIAGCGGGLLFLGSRQALFCLLAGAFAAWLPVWHVRRKARTRIARFEDQFPDLLQFVSRSMRAGHAFSSALGMAHREFSPPISVEFRRAFEESNLGQPMEAVLVKLALRVPSLDVRFYA